MGKKFIGLDGLKHFWSKAKTWITEQITAEVTAKIAEIVADAPEDLDTLKEIADWISTHADSASAMNTKISTNTSDIADLKTSVAGKANSSHTHTKSQITDFAHTHDDRYFTETEVTNKLEGKSDTGHTHTKSEITDLGNALLDKQSIIDAVYPVGSLYWSSKSTSPATLFGGTWVQIKDKFVLACGDTYKTTGATGGASTVTLAVENLPSHNHSYTPSGKITMTAHTHGLNDHTHSFTPSGTIAVKTNPTFTGSSNTSGSMSENSTGTITNVGIRDKGTGSPTGNFSGSQFAGSANDEGSSSGVGYLNVKLNVAHTHSFTAKGSISGGAYTFTGTAGTTDGNTGNTTSVTSSGTFTGTAGTTGSSGSGTAFSILPPYVVKYCWERTA